MADYLKIFCENIKRLQIERKITKQDLAALGGVAGSVITDLIQGKGNPTLKTMEALAEGLEIPLPILLKPLDSDEWQAITSAVRYKAEEPVQSPQVPTGYGLIEQVILPQNKVDVIKEWMNAPRRGRPRKN